MALLQRVIKAGGQQGMRQYFQPCPPVGLAAGFANFPGSPVRSRAAGLKRGFVENGKSRIAGRELECSTGPAPSVKQLRARANTLHLA